MNRSGLSKNFALVLLIAFFLGPQKAVQAYDCCYLKFDCLDPYVCFVYCNGIENPPCTVVVQDFSGGYDVAPAGCDILGICWPNYGLDCPTILTGRCDYTWTPDPNDLDCDFETINACLDPYDICELGQNSINCTYPGGICCP